MIFCVPQGRQGDLSVYVACLTQHTKQKIAFTSETTHNPSSDRDAVPEGGLVGTGRTLGAVVFGSIGAWVGCTTGGGVASVGK